MSKPHSIVPDPQPLSENDRYCPKCNADWQGAPIPPIYLNHYGGKTHFSRLIGIEDRSIYDGICLWKCPDCQEEFPRKGFERLRQRKK